MVGESFARGIVGESAAFSSVTDLEAGKRLQRVRCRWCCVLMSRSASGMAGREVRSGSVTQNAVSR